MCPFLARMPNILANAIEIPQRLAGVLRADETRDRHVPRSTAVGPLLKVLFCPFGDQTPTSVSGIGRDREKTPPRFTVRFRSGPQAVSLVVNHITRCVIILRPLFLEPPWSLLGRAKIPSEINPQTSFLCLLYALQGAYGALSWNDRANGTALLTTRAGDALHSSGLSRRAHSLRHSPAQRRRPLGDIG
uniref:Transposase n=1 Tax=Steinernema glaseri TaxID=37863 RepID=A0A1I7ZWX0_9BILA